MFISEIDEVNYWGFEDIDENLIDHSNERFASIMSRYLNEPLDVLYGGLLHNYGFVSRYNPIARFNLNRLSLTKKGSEHIFVNN